MLVYGRNVLKELPKEKIKKIYIASKELIPYLKENNLKYNLVTTNVLDNLVKGNHQGVVIDTLDYAYKKLEDIEGNFVVMLDHIEDPHNLGAIIRTCECAGIKDVIIPKDRCALINDTVVHTSAGAVSNVNIIMVSNLVNAINSLKRDGYFVYAASMEGKSYKEVSFNERLVLVIGNEGKGVSELVKKNSDVIISIPMKGKINSLNASVSAGILIYGINNE